MPTFSNAPPEDPRGFALPLVRCPTGQGLQGIVTSLDLIGCATHFFGGRTVPHERDNCEPCKNGHTWRWHSWLAAYSPRQHDCFLFESTARATQVFVKYREAHGTLRGCQFRAQRRTGARNSRVYLECQPAHLEGLVLPEPPDLLKCLSFIWNIPLPSITVEGIARGAPAVTVRGNGQGDFVCEDGSVASLGNENR